MKVRHQPRNLTKDIERILRDCLPKLYVDEIEYCTDIIVEYIEKREKNVNS